jgi:hypothetical protein
MKPEYPHQEFAQYLRCPRNPEGVPPKELAQSYSVGVATISRLSP